MKQNTWTEEPVPSCDEAETGEQTIGGVVSRARRVAKLTFYKWRKKYTAAWRIDGAKRLRVEQENARLKRLLADSRLEIDALQGRADKMSQRRPTRGGHTPAAAAPLLAAAGVSNGWHHASKRAVSAMRAAPDARPSSAADHAPVSAIRAMATDGYGPCSVVQAQRGGR